jgi:hypothetical protein
MGEIVAAVRRVTDLMGEISAAAGEQSQGIGEVNTVIVQMDDATQRNAALVEEASAAAASMQEQAQGLVRTVGRFRLEAGVAGGPASGPGTVVATRRPGDGVGSGTVRRAG